MQSTCVKSVRARLVSTLLAIAATSVAGCGGGGTTPPTIPIAPTAVQTAAENGQVTISWSAVAGATSYNIYWSTVAVNGTAIATAASGQTNAASGATVVLSDGSTEIDRLIVP